MGASAVLLSIDKWLIVPFLFWLLSVAAMLLFLIPKLQKTSEEQADARALMTGRITDAYANIATVKLFSHSRRESAYAKEAMQIFLGKVHNQMHLVSVLEFLVNLISVLLVVGSVCLSLWLWSIGKVGAVAIAGALAIRLQGLTHWVLWETVALFEHLGTVQDGMQTLTTPHAIKDRADAQVFLPKRGCVQYQHVSFGYGKAGKPLLDDFSLEIRAGEKVGLVGKSGAGKSTLVNLLL